MKTTVDDPIFTLYYYFLYADHMRYLFDQRAGEINKDGILEDDDVVLRLYLDMWYAFLYTVIEGWESLVRKNNVTDNNIDIILEDKKKQMLKEYRNTVFHPRGLDLYYVEENKHRRSASTQDIRTDFYISDDSILWVRKVHGEFSRFFREYNVK